jgi:Na+-driven multidrug efflux pump
MPLQALCSYYNAVLPGALGANRSDRIPRYLYRSMLLAAVGIVPSVVLMCFAAPILSRVGVPETNARGVGAFCQLMVPVTFLTLIDNHLQATFMNLRYVRVVATTSLLTGLGIQVPVTVALVGVLGMGIRGAAYARLAVTLCRVVVWLIALKV